MAIKQPCATISASYLLKEFKCFQCKKPIKVPKTRLGALHCLYCNKKYRILPVLLFRLGRTSFKCPKCGTSHQFAPDKLTAIFQAGKPFPCDSCKTPYILRPLVRIKPGQTTFACTNKNCKQKVITVPVSLHYPIVMCNGCRTAHELLVMKPGNRAKKKKVAELSKGEPDKVERQIMDDLFDEDF
ncbi:MAG: hypothetical protein ABIG20_01550 [archaeon]